MTSTINEEDSHRGEETSSGLRDSTDDNGAFITGSSRDSGGKEINSEESSRKEDLDSLIIVGEVLNIDDWNVINKSCTIKDLSGYVHLETSQIDVGSQLKLDVK